MYVLDTNVVSELRKGRNSRVGAWAATVPGHLMFLSVITVMELETDILRLGRKVVATRNTKDFKTTGVFAFNP